MAQYKHKYMHRLNRITLEFEGMTVEVEPLGDMENGIGIKYAAEYKPSEPLSLHQSSVINHLVLEAIGKISFIIGNTHDHH